MILSAAGPGIAGQRCASIPYLVPELNIAAREANQGVASDGEAIFAVDNSAIGKYRISDGARVAAFAGDPHRFPHLNSCTLALGQLVCASSNYPAVPHRGSAEFFDPGSLAHLRSVALPENPGSLTVLARHDGHWWAVFANYDGKGGISGRDHRQTRIARLGDDFRIARWWRLPASVLTRTAPRSISGASFGRDGRLYASGHDKPEIYVLEIPASGRMLHHVATLATASFGQAIDIDPADPMMLWSIDRKLRRVIASRLPTQDHLPRGECQP